MPDAEVPDRGCDWWSSSSREPTGDSRNDTLRVLKRYIARETFAPIRDALGQETALRTAARHRGLNALAETTIGLYKHECVRADSPFRRGPEDRLSDLEMITADWVHWYNTSRLMHHLDLRPPVEAEADYHANNRDGRPATHT